MMGGAIYSLKIPFTKTNSGILALTEEELGTKDEVACIRCGRCASHCPMHLMPMYISEYGRVGKYKKKKDHSTLLSIKFSDDK